MILDCCSLVVLIQILTDNRASGILSAIGIIMTGKMPVAPPNFDVRFFDLLLLPVLVLVFS